MKTKSQFENTSDTFGRYAVDYLIAKDLKKKYAEILAEKHQVHRSKNKNSIKWILSIAASLLILFGSTLIITKSLKDDSLALASHFVKNTNILGNQNITRKDITFSNQLRQEANAAFVLKDYEKSIVEYEKLVNSAEVEDIDKFYLGVSYLKSKKPKPVQAINVFKEIQSNQALSNETYWFLSLAYILNHNFTEAQFYLNKLHSQGEYKIDDSKKLLEMLSKNKE